MPAFLQKFFLAYRSSCRSVGQTDGTACELTRLTDQHKPKICKNRPKIVLSFMACAWLIGLTRTPNGVVAGGLLVAAGVIVAERVVVSAAEPTSDMDLEF